MVTATSVNDTLMFEALDDVPAVRGPSEAISVSGITSFAWRPRPLMPANAGVDQVSSNLLCGANTLGIIDTGALGFYGANRYGSC